MAVGTAAAAHAAVVGAIKGGTEVIGAVSELKSAVEQLYQSFEGAKDFKDRHRSLELLVINATSKPLTWQPPYFDSGTTYAGPIPINVPAADADHPAGVSLWTVANGQGSIATGVSGAGKWKIGNSGFSFLIGFTNPQFGSFKNAIIIAPDNAAAKSAYDASEDVHAKQVSDHGFTATVYADEGKVGGHRRFVFAIAESN